MTVTSSVHELAERWTAALDRADVLRITVCEDTPASFADGHGPSVNAIPVPVEQTGETMLEIVDLLRAGHARLSHLLDGDDDGFESERGETRAAVSFVHDRKLDVDPKLATLRSVERLLAVAEIAASDDTGRWHLWWNLVVRETDELVAALHSTDALLVQCWRELSEGSHVRVGSATIGRLSVRHAEDKSIGGR
jgi:hypothetical protein